MELKKYFATSPAEAKGVWFKEGDARFLVAAFSSRAYRDKLETLLEPHQRAVRRGLMDRTERDGIA